jgi:hypothetical protein
MLVLDLVPEHVDKLDAGCLEHGQVVDLRFLQFRDDKLF